MQTILDKKDEKITIRVSKNVKNKLHDCIKVYGLGDVSSITRKLYEDLFKSKNQPQTSRKLRVLT